MLNGTDMHYDVISGISVGSINAGGLSLYPKGQEKEATELLRTMWLNLTNNDIWKFWPGFEPYQALFN
jgi:predicted acylesterase/phospholipase RssA